MTKTGGREARRVFGVGRGRTLPRDVHSTHSALEPQRRGAHGGQRQRDLRPHPAAASPPEGAIGASLSIVRIGYQQQGRDRPE